uniref:G-protein coupled receptors family 3 profile domain-containing protein n=1 Tax=Denticeps clupeoides TaxID=299321 RepID=A0AAY4DPH0_9TELE
MSAGTSEWVLLGILLLSYNLLAGFTLGSECQRLGDFNPPMLEADGDVVIGGLFPMHYMVSESDQTYASKPQASECSGFDVRAFRWVQTMVFAIEEINNSSLLPGVRLGYRILDSCDHVHTGLRSVMSLVSFSLGQDNSSEVLQCVDSAPVSYFATCTCLTDKQVYPSFLRTVPSDLFQVQGLVQLVTHFDWRWVGTIGTEDDYSNYGIQAFAEHLQTWGGCVAFHRTIPKEPTEAQINAIADILETSTAHVVVAFATEGQLYSLLTEIARRNLTHLQWVASEAWVTAGLLTAPEFHSVLTGTLGFSFRGTMIPGLADFLFKVRPSPGSVFTNMFWEELFRCKLSFASNADPQSKLCTGNEDIKAVRSSYSEVSRVRISYNVYKAVYAIAHALHQLLKCGPKDQACNNTMTVKPWQVKKPLCVHANITNATECTKCPLYYWSDKDRVTCVAGVEEFLDFQETMGIILVILALLGVTVAMAITVIFFFYKSTPIVKANNSEISFLLLLSIKLCFLCSLVFIGRPSAWSCRARQAAFGISFVLCISCILVKTIVVLLAFRSTLPGSNALKLFGPLQQRAFILCCTAVQVILCASWLALAPPVPFKNTSYQGGRIVLECKDVWPIGFYLVLGYIGLLSALCFVLAFLGRKLPDTFNEGKLITFSMLIFFAVWISFIPAHNSSPGKYTVAVEMFAILASSFGLLFCIFAPKCYIILFRPEQNIRKGMTGKYPNK